MNSKELDEFYSRLKQSLNGYDDLAMPAENNNDHPDIHELLNNTNHKNIYLTSDWHFFKNHYKKEANYVNTQKILTWCRQNIKSDDIFMYLGDISFRYANKEDQKESQKLLASIPGYKVLILGNHDMMLGQDYFSQCGFHYVYERLDWQNIIFTHKPIPMEIMPEDFINIHGHMHKWREYNTTNGKRNINVYPWFFDNKPVTLDYCLNHIDQLIKDNKRSNWTNMGESGVNLEISRANLRNNQFGIPEDRKYPLDSEKHVMSAIKLFGHAEESKKKALAKRIKTAANKYDIKIPETTQVYKYLSESYLFESFVGKLNIPPEVENIVFDMGGVLVDDNGVNAYKSNKNIPEEYCEEIYDFINRELFFAKSDKKVLYCELPEAKEYIFNITPEHIKPYIDDIFEAIANDLYKLNYADDIINIFKTKGYKIYYLSNWEKCLYDIEHRIFDSLIKQFNGGLFSYECHIEKPSLSIYKLFTDKFNLEPNKCLFFDDKQENLDAAKVCGWHTILFDKDNTPNDILGITNYAGLSDIEHTKLKVNEWSMAAMNPIKSITKPYILKMCDDHGSLINAKQYALATDLISDKYLVINENANLEIVDRSNLSNMVVEEYEFIGDKRLIKKIEEAYYSNKTVDNTFFYTALTGKPMLSEDQIDFDPNFRKVDFIAMKEKALTQLATLFEGYNISTGVDSIKVNTIPNSYTRNLTGNKSHITIMEDLDGYYAFNTEKNIRSVSVEEQEFLTEQMIDSIL